jgi:sortase system peptidoglycan-associated protein
MASTSAFASENIFADKQTAIERHQEKINNENMGFGTGAIIGGVIAGPLGAMVAGIGGTLIAKFINVKDDNEVLSTALIEEKHLYKRNNEQTEKQYQAELQRLQNAYQQQLAALEKQQQNTGQIQADNLLMSLQFSTGSSDIAPHYQDQVTALAQILVSSPTMKIDLSGYTDLTGGSALNQTLSKARVESVKTMLMTYGVDEEQIATFAFGDNAPVVANDTRKVSFYDRRVVLKLHKTLTAENNRVANIQ